MNKVMKIGLSVLVVLGLIAGSTHIWLPSSMDDCQRDISHQDHLWSLAPFHCLGHTEFAYDTDPEGGEVIIWDHLHPWMTYSWFMEQGFSKTEAKSFVEASKTK